MIISGFILFLIGLLAFSLSAVCGGGASFILIPVLGWVLPGAQIPAALSIGTSFSSLSRISLFWNNIKWKIVFWFVPPAIPAAWLGAKLLTYLNPVYLEILIAIFLLSNLTLIIRPKIQSSSTEDKPKIFLSLIGASAGFVSGLTGAVGLLFNKFYLRYGLSKEEIVATRAANELLIHILKLLLYFSFGLLTYRVLSFGFLIGIAAIIATFFIKRLLPYLSEAMFQKIGYGAMVIAGIGMLLNGSANFLNQNKFALSFKPVSDGTETKIQWNKSSFAMDFEYGDGFEIEYEIDFDDLPVNKREQVKSLIANSDKSLLEEVYSFDKHYYEVYVYNRGVLKKYDIE